MKSLIERIAEECDVFESATVSLGDSGLLLRIEAWCIFAELQVRNSEDLDRSLRQISTWANGRLPFNYYRAALITKLLRQAYYHGIRSVQGVEV